MIWMWIGFLAFIIALLILDLAIVHRRDEVIPARAALGWVGFFVALALAFNVGVYFIYQNDWLGFGTNFQEHTRRFSAEQLVLARQISPEQVAAWQPPPGSDAAAAIRAPGWTAAIQFFTGWLTEYSLSIDNIFVIAVIFAHFRVPAAFQHRVLFWGILGALVMRGIMILGGTALINQFHWLLYLFGAFLIYGAIKIALAQPEGDEDFENRRIIRWTRRLIPISSRYDGHHFFTRTPDGRRIATPLFLVLIIVEVTDLIFAVDSIPAILGITTDPFLVFTSNVFAILGLRSLFFALSGFMNAFHYLKFSLAAILAFVGVKMLLEIPAIGVHISSPTSLAVIGSLLTLGVIASLIHARRHPPDPAAPSDNPPPLP